MFDYDQDLNDSITSIVVKTDDREFTLSRVNSIEFELSRLYLTYKSCRENDLLLQKDAKSVTINLEATSITYKVSEPRIEDLALYPSRLLDLEEAQKLRSILEDMRNPDIIATIGMTDEEGNNEIIGSVSRT